MLGNLFPIMFGKENLHHHHCGNRCLVPMFSQVTPTVLPVPRPSVGEVILCYFLFTSCGVSHNHSTSQQQDFWSKSFQLAKDFPMFPQLSLSSRVLNCIVRCL